MDSRNIKEWNCEILRYCAGREVAEQAVQIREFRLLHDLQDVYTTSGRSDVPACSSLWMGMSRRFWSYICIYPR